jgi:hypothetical protein
VTFLFVTNYIKERSIFPSSSKRGRHCYFTIIFPIIKYHKEHKSGFLFQMVPPPLPPRRNYTVKGNQKLVYQAQGMQLSAATTAATAATNATTAATAATNAATNAATIAAANITVLPSASIASFHNGLGTDTISVMPAASTTASYYNNNGVVAVASIGANTNSSAIAKGAESSTSIANVTATNRSWGHGVSLRGIPTSYLI